jgi:hypothetical protein
VRPIFVPIVGVVFAGVLLAVGAPVVPVLVVGAVMVCAAMTLVLGLGDPDGERLLETARRAGRPPQE